MQNKLWEKVVGNVGRILPTLQLTQRELIAVPFHTTFEPAIACCFFGN
jgi:hypothetical protein